MSKVVYVGVDEIARKARRIYVGVDGVARKVKKGYVGVNGVARLFYESYIYPFISYSGEYTMTPITDNGAEYDLYTLTTIGTLVLAGEVDCWLCGGGGGGGGTTSNSGSGGGGGGGYVESGNLNSGSHVVTIGAGGGANTDGGVTTAGVLSANGGKTGNNMDGGDGGSGGGGGYQRRYGAGGAGAGVSTYPFGITSLNAHCAGGAGGDYARYVTVTTEVGGYYYDHKGNGSGGSNGGNGENGNNNESFGGSGGNYGGGDSGDDATFYGGGGGGGKFTIYNADGDSYSRNGGSGYQGVVYLLIETKSTPKSAEIITQPTNATGVVGDTVSFTVEATGVASYHWQYGSNGTRFYDLPTDDSRYLGVTSPTTEIEMTNSSVNWYYRCKLTGEDGNVVYTDVVQVDTN